METDSFFCRLFKHLPQTLFELLELPPSRVKSYRFDSVELKKSLRIDGLFRPNRKTKPLFFVEVQFQPLRTFYANLFAKVFCYLEENEPGQEWVAVAIFRSRKEEPKDRGPYEDLLESKRLKRIYLDDHKATEDMPVGLGLLRLLFATAKEAQELAPRIVWRAHIDFADSDLDRKVVELLEGLLLSRFPEFSREEMRMKFKLHDIRESKVWKEARNEEREETVRKCLAKGKTPKEIAEFLDIPLEEIRRMEKADSKAG